MIPCSCAASRASAICFAMANASSSGIAPRAIRCDKIIALDQFHHEGGDAVGVLQSVDGCDVRMIQRGEDFRFALKASQPVGITHQRRRQDLDGDLTLQLRVRRPIHLPHPAHADLGGDFVDTEAGAGSEGQAVGLYGRSARSRRDYSRSTAKWRPGPPAGSLLCCGPSSSPVCEKFPFNHYPRVRLRRPDDGLRSSRGSGCEPWVVTQRSPSIRARADRAAPRDCAVSYPDTVLPHPLASGRVTRPSDLSCAARVSASIRAGRYATFRIAPAGTTPVVTYRHNAIRSLRATATMPIRRARVPCAKRSRYHCVRGLCGCQRTHVQAS